MPQDYWGNAIFSLIPTIVLGLIFWMVLRFIIRGDRTARREYDRLEAEERAKAGLPPRPPRSASGDAAAEASAQADAPADAQAASQASADTAGSEPADRA